MEIPKQIPNKITEPIVGLAFQEYRKALYAQLHDKHVTIHLAAIKTLVTLVLKYNNVSRGSASQSPNEGNYQLQHLELHSPMMQLHEYTDVDKGATPDFEERADNSSNHSLSNESYTQISNAQHITEAAANGFDVSKYEALPGSHVSRRIDNEMFDQAHRQRIRKLKNQMSIKNKNLKKSSSITMTDDQNSKK